MKRSICSMIVFGFALCCILSNDSFAQRFSPEDQTQQLKETLKLTTNQTAQVLKILTDASNKRQALWSQNSEDRTAMRDSMMALQKKTDAQIKLVLKHDQIVKYDSVVTARRMRMQQMQRQ